MENKKLCKHCKSEIPADATVCPQCRKKQSGGKLKWIILGIIAIVVVAAVAGSSNGGSKKVGEVTKSTIETKKPDQATPEKTDESTEATKETAPVSTQVEYHVGDILQDDDMRIVYIASGEHTEDNEFMQPAEGNKYIFLQFAFENTSDKSDASISMYNFECYADGYNAEMFYGGDDDLNATLSAGRSTTGSIYFEVPEDAQKIEVEYTANIFLDNKIIFVYDGEKDSGYTPEANTSASADAYEVGSIVDAKDVKITYLSCEPYESDNMFSQPKDGHHFVTCTFEFENISKKDQHIGSFDFDCFADGASCEQTYIRDDDLTATLSPGRKASGTVTFEIPDDAQVVEVEYDASLFTSNRIVFSVQ